MPIFLVFLFIPLIEIAAFIEIGGRIGLGATIAMVVITALAGTAMLRRQGQETMQGVRRSLSQGKFPAAALFDGFCLVIAGALLITPGFFTDGIGFLLFVPPFRKWLRRMLIDKGIIRVYSNTSDPQRPSSTSPKGDDVIEGSYRKIDERDL